MKHVYLALVGGLVCGYLPMLAMADGKSPEVLHDSGSFIDAISGGKPLIQFRGRYEHVDQDGKAKTADAWTLRSLIGWETLPFHQLRLGAQFINVTHLSHQFYDNDHGQNLPSVYPTVQDPNITDVNQLYLQYEGLPDTKIRLGRQLAMLDNVRFIGNVEFRQDSQVFDGISLVNNSFENLEFYLAHYERVRQTTTKLRDTHLEILHANYKLTPTESVSAYEYFQDQPVTGQNTGFSNNSNQILGLRLDGNHMVNDQIKILYTTEYAKQDNYQGGNGNIDAYYLRLGGGVSWQGWYLRFDQETLSSNHGVYGFQTPLATLHPFQGWADQFTTTPKEGMQDKFVSFGGKLSDLTLTGEWHRYDADQRFVSVDGQREHYGGELDLGAAYSFAKQWIGKLEYANFKEGNIYGATVNSSTRKRDTEKFWATLIFNY